MTGFPYLVKCEIAFTSPTSAPTWTDMSSRLMAFTSHVGQQYDYDGPQPGTLDVTLDNTDGALDPDNSSSPYYGSILPNRLVRLSAQITSSSPLVYLATGYVDSWQRSFNLAHSQTVVSCTDLSKYYNRRTVAGLSAAAGTAAQHMGYVSGSTSPGTFGGLNFSATGYGGIQWDLITDIAIADGGLFYVDGNNYPTYLTSGYRDNNTHSTTVQETFAFGLSTGTEVEDASMVPVQEDRLLANVITVFDSALTGHVSSDATSRAAYGDIPFQISTGLTASAAATRAAYLKTHRATARPRVDSLTIDALTGDQQMSDAMYLLMGDRVRLNYQGLGGGAASSRDYWIHGISHSVDFQNPQWMTSYQLQATTS